MPKKKFRFYSSDDKENGLTPSQLKRASREKQIAYVTYWFYETHFDGPFDVPKYSEYGGNSLRNAMLDQYFPSVSPNAALTYFDGLVTASVISDAAKQIRPPNMWWCYKGRSEIPDDLTDISVIENLERTFQKTASEAATEESDSFGTPFERKRRAAIVTRLDGLDRHLTQMPQRWKKVAPNRVPQDEEEGQPQADELRQTSAALRAELGKGKPSTKAVARSALTLTNILKWLKTFHALVKEVSSISGIIGGRLLAASAAWKLIEPDIHGVLNGVNEWLHAVMHVAS